MATVPTAAPLPEAFVSVRGYLNTGYSPDCEYVNGRIVDRPSPGLTGTDLRS